MSCSDSVSSPNVVVAATSVAPLKKVFPESYSYSQKTIAKRIDGMGNCLLQSRNNVCTFV